MGKNLFIKLSIVLLTIGFIVHNPVLAAGNSNDDMRKAQKFVDKAIEYTSSGNLPEAQKSYDQFNKTWIEIEGGIKQDSTTAYRDIESNMGKVVYAFTLKKPDQVLQALNESKGSKRKSSKWWLSKRVR